jgi:hypothetical protein
LLQSLVQGLCVATEKRETERTKEKTKEFAAVQKKNLDAKTKERTKDKKREREREEKSEYSCYCSKLILFILCDYICVQACVSKQGLA